MVDEDGLGSEEESGLTFWKKGDLPRVRKASLEA